ncbi:hypothetical protein [Arthrobacter sp. NPDC057009]|uniref:hypothetical protein n=1 Tax=Arthrobacter sp. NPDC057009 TaxID=3345996 RepID=UPI00362BF213
MRTGINAAIRRSVELHIVADDPFPGQSWLDQLDMPRGRRPSGQLMSGRQLRLLAYVGLAALSKTTDVLVMLAIRA